MGAHCPVCLCHSTDKMFSRHEPLDSVTNIDWRMRIWSVSLPRLISFISRHSICVVTMSDQSNVYLVGDQTYDINDGLLRLLHSECDFLLTSFFQKTFYALREEIGKLPLEQRTHFRCFSSLTDLLALRRDGHLLPPLDQALASTYHLATFMR